MTADDRARGVIKRTLIVSVALAASASAAVMIGVTTPAAGSSTTSAELVTEVPDSIPPDGVNINGQVILMPPSTPDSGTMDSAEAIDAAREYADTGVDPSALLADVTVPGTIPTIETDIPFRTIQDRQAWVVTFTSNEPVLVGTSKGNSDAAGLFVTHFSVVLDADTGEFLIGFYTK